VGILVLIGLLNDYGYVRFQPMTLQELLQEAEKFLAKGKLIQARKHARKAMEKEPGCAKAWELLVTVLRTEGKREDALDAVRRARDMYEVDSKILKELEEDLGTTLEGLLEEAEKCMEQNNWSRAAEFAKSATDKDPESVTAWQVLAYALKWEGKREEAAATIKKAQELYEVNSDVLKQLASELEKNVRPGTLAAEHEKKGEEFKLRRQYDLAVECYEKALDILGEMTGECPEQLLVTGAEAVQERRMGEFTKLDAVPTPEQDGRPIWQNKTGQYLFYWKPAGCWRIGPKYSDGGAGVKSTGKEVKPMCPTKCSAWKTHHGGAWTTEHAVTVKRGEITTVEKQDKALRLRLVRSRAECAQQLQDWSTVKSDATTLLAEDPNDYRALLLRAVAYESLEKYKAALTDAMKVLATDPRNAAANRIVHNCQQEIGY